MMADVGEAEIRYCLPISEETLTSKLLDLSYSLARAAELHKASGLQQEAVLFGIKGVIDFLKALQFPADQVEPFHHLFQELMDMGDGRRPSKLLNPREKNNNAEQGSTFWGLRAALWTAVQIRSQMYDARAAKNPVAFAAGQVAKEYPRSSEVYKALRRGQDSESFGDERGITDALKDKLITLHDTIGDEKYPRDCGVEAYVDVCRNELKDLANLSAQHRDERLRRMLDAMLGFVDRYLNRLS